MEGLEIPVQALANANRKLELLLENLRPAPESRSISAEGVAAALAEVLRVGEWLRGGLARSPEVGMAEELDRYRKLLEQLQQLLPRLHAHLLAERFRLEAERVHLESAAAWARSASAR